MKPWLKYSIIGVIIIAAPIAVNCLLQVPSIMSIVGTDIDWLSFWGSYLGAIISALVAFLVLHRQLKQNHEENNSNRKLQIGIMKSEQAKSWLNELRTLLAKYLLSFNYDAIDKAAFDIAHGSRKNKPSFDFETLANEKKQVDVSLRLFLSGCAEPEMKEYRAALDGFSSEYLSLIEDLSWLSNLLYGQKEPGSMKEKTENYKCYHLSQIDNQNRIWFIIEKYKFEIQPNLVDILKERLEIIKDYSPALIEGVLNALLKYQETRINTIIDEKEYYGTEHEA